MNYYNLGTTNLPNSGSTARPRYEFERWVEQAFTNNSVLTAAGIRSVRNSSGSSGAAAGSGSFPDFILYHNRSEIYLECKSFKGNPSEIQDNSTVPSGKYLTNNGTIVDVHYLYCNYDGNTGGITKLAVIDAHYYGDNPTLLKNISDFVYVAIEQHIKKVGSLWQVKRGPRDGIYINNISPYSEQRLRCRIRQMYHSGNPFISHDSLQFFCITPKSKWIGFQNRTILGNFSLLQSDYSLKLNSQNASVDFIILQPS